jgi:tripeptidyl-peptidase-1
VSFFYCLAVAIALPNTNPSRHVIHERRDRLPDQWKKHSKLHPDSIVPLRIALKQNNLEKAHEYLMDVSDPKSLNYGKHWSVEQVAKTFAPSHETVSKVIEWLTDFGIAGAEQSPSLSWVSVNVTISQVEVLLDTEYFEYKHDTTDQSHVACEQYSLPQHIQEHVDFVTPTMHFDIKVKSVKRDEKKSRSLRAAKNKIPIPQKVFVAPGTDTVTLKGCNISIFPACLRSLYGIPETTKPNPKSEFNGV